MALVRISKQLLQDVERTVNNIKNKTLETVVEPKNPTKNPVYTDKCVERALEAAWGDHAHLKDVVPQNWMTKIGRVDITITPVIPEFQVAKTVLFPPKTEIKYGDYVEVRLPELAAPDGMITEYRAYFKERAETAKKFETIGKQIATFLKSCKSLNDALKKYPEVALYVPQAYLDIITEVRTREAREKEEAVAEPEIDKELITSMGVLGSLQG